MKVLVLGAGTQGGPCSSILCRQDDITSVVLADVDSEVLKKAESRIGSQKLQTVRVDASSVNEIIEAGRGCDLIIDLMPYWLAVNVMKAALEVGAHYVNTAFVEPFWGQLAAGEPLELSSEFKQNNLTALLGCGKAPGLLNIITRHYADKLDTVNSIKYRVGSKNISHGPYDHIFKPWNPGWSPKAALIDYALPISVFADGQYKQLEAFSGLEEWDFPAPIGNMLISHHEHEELHTIPRFIGKGITYCDFKYIVAYQPAVLVTLGLVSQEEIDIDGVKIKPIDLITRFIPKPGNLFLEETRDSATQMSRDKHFSMVTFINGEKDGKKVDYSVNCPMFRGQGVELFERYGTAICDVALPAITGGKMIMEEAERGVIFPEQLDPKRYFELFKQSGFDLILEEL